MALQLGLVGVVIAVFSAADASVVVGVLTLVGLIISTFWARRAAKKADEAAGRAQTANVLARETAQQVQTPNGETLGNMVKMTSDLSLRTASKLDELTHHVIGMGNELQRVENAVKEHHERQAPLEERFLEEHPDLRPKENG